MKGRKGEGRMEGKKESHEGFNTQVRNISKKERKNERIKKRKKKERMKEKKGKKGRMKGR